MIINIRGTNGSGKTTIVRQIVGCHETVTTIQYPPERGNKRRPLGYLCARDTRRLFIPGHYEIANGGIDTIHDLEYAHKIILYHHSLGADVLYEGMNFTDKIDWIIRMHEAKLDIRVAFINHPVEACIKSVRKRGHAIRKETIRKLHTQSLNECTKIQALKIPCINLSRQGTLDNIKMWLGIGAV
jgi:predicted ABC-type ATPase